MTFPKCADINLCLHSYLFPSQTELKVIGHRLLARFLKEGVQFWYHDTSTVKGGGGGGGGVEKNV